MPEIDKFEKILKNHEDRISKLEKLINTDSKLILQSDEKILLKLIDNGFFNNPRKRNEIIKKLKTDAKFNSKAKYNKILKKMTGEDKLKRQNINNQWAYTKK